jgi:hypothetical protein
MESIPEHLETLLRSLASDALKEDKNSKRVGRRDSHRDRASPGP